MHHDLSYFLAAASSGSGGPDTVTLVMVGVIAALPGLFAAWVSNRTRRDKSREVEASAGVDFAQQGFDALKTEVTNLREERREWQMERERWAEERERWHTERSTLTIRLEEVQYAVHRLCLVLEQNNIAVPDAVKPLVRKRPSSQ